MKWSGPGVAAIAIGAGAVTLLTLTGVTHADFSTVADLFGGTSSAQPDRDDAALQVDPESLVPVGRNAMEAVWTDGGIVVGTSRTNGPDRLLMLNRKHPNDPLRPLDIPRATRDCERLEYRFLVAAPGGFDAVQDCVIRGGTYESVQRLVHVDLEKETVRPLFDVGWIHRSLRTFTLSPHRRYGVVSEGSLICNSLLKISNSGYSRPAMSPADLVPDQGRVVVPNDGLRHDCNGQGVAWSAAISAQNDLAFEASPAAATEAGVDRLFARAGLYVQPAGELDAELMVDDVSDVRLAWHPTERVLATSFVQQGLGSIELLDPETGTLTTVSSSGWAGQLAWNPQGTQLLTIMRRPPGYGDTKIRKWLLTYKVCGDLPGLSANPRSPLADYPCDQRQDAG